MITCGFNLEFIYSGCRDLTKLTIDKGLLIGRVELPLDVRELSTCRNLSLTTDEYLSEDTVYADRYRSTLSSSSIILHVRGSDLDEALLVRHHDTSS